jgi:hypothetical protein
MERTMVRYRVKPDRAEENAGYIRDVFAQLEREAPSGIRYDAFRLDDGVSFVHIVSKEAADGADTLRGLPAFKTFIADIRDRCEEPPVASHLHEVGSYRVFVDR